MQRLIKLAASFFYVGYLPYMPGTWGSLCGVLIYLLIRQSFPTCLGISLFLTVIGFLVCGKAEIIFKEKDSGKIVIDEVSAMLLSYLFVPFSHMNLMLGFIFFRIFDITKPYPARNIQNLPGSAGVMLDDIIAAFYTNLCLQAINLLILR
ncbi:MAG: phosphatidylglycerophosphatase A [PVC group bacterium]|nr:phosphatidylglycerophosphatase A [PVC group bacterium]